MTSTVAYSRTQTRRRSQGRASVSTDQPTLQEPNLAVVLEHLNDLCSRRELQGRPGDVDLGTLVRRLENNFDDWKSDHSHSERRRIVAELLENGQKQNLCTNVGGDLWRNGPSTDDASYKSLEKGAASTRDPRLLTQPTTTEATRSVLDTQRSEPAVESKPRRRVGGTNCEKCSKACEKEVRELQDKNYDLDCLYCALKTLKEKRDAQHLEKARRLSLEEAERREQRQKAADLALAQKAHEESRKSTRPKIGEEKLRSSCPECRKRAESGGQELYTLEEALKLLRRFDENGEKKLTAEEMATMMATSMQKERQKELSQQSIMVYGKPAPPPTVNPEHKFPPAAFHQHEVGAKNAQDERDARERRRKARGPKSAKKSKSSSKKSSEKKKQKSSKKKSSSKKGSKKGKMSKTKHRQEKKKPLAA